MLFSGASVAQSLLYSNGGLNPQSMSNSGVAAPAGFFWSEIQNDTGNTAESNTTAGSAVSQDSFRLADDFVVPAGQTWDLEAVEFHAYQTNASAAATPFTGYTLQIWSGRPGDQGSTVVFGDTTTNRFATSTNSTYFRIFNSSVPPPGSTPGTNRTIWRNRITIDPPLSLTQGTYWLDWASTVSNAGAHFQPAVTLPGARGAAGWNARQLTVATSTWADVIDTGNPATAPDIPQDFPFDLYGMAIVLPDELFSDGFEEPTP
jgi:serine protease